MNAMHDWSGGPLQRRDHRRVDAKLPGQPVLVGIKERGTHT
jgi:hypothetical protein